MSAKIQTMFGRLGGRRNDFWRKTYLFKIFQCINVFGSKLTLPTTISLIFIPIRFIFYPIIKKLNCFSRQPVKK